jgi:hypothetical protein
LVTVDGTSGIVNDWQLADSFDRTDRTDYGPAHDIAAHRDSRGGMPGRKEVQHVLPRVLGGDRWAWDQFAGDQSAEAPV